MWSPWHLLPTVLAAGLAAQTPAPKPIAEWPAYGRDAEGSRFSPLTDISPDNVASLRVAWRYSTGEASGPDTGRPTSLEATPIVVDGTLFFSTPLGRVIALDPETGAERWVFDAKVSRKHTFGDWTSRGVSTWLDSRAAPTELCRRRIIVATVDARLISLDATTGALCRRFGSQGMVDLRHGLRNAPFELEEYEETSPPAVVGDVIVVGSGVADNNRIDAASGEVRGFDARTGRLLWSWDPVPQDPHDPAYASWHGADAHRTGAANAWSVIAADPERDLVVIPTGSASPDYFGGKRLGQNRYANSVVALRASTGKLVWSFQTAHHDLWDYDNASPPALVTVTKGSAPTPAVLQATKSGMLFVLNRETGEPLWPVEERPVPASDVAGEEAWPTQPFSTIEALSPASDRPQGDLGGERQRPGVLPEATGPASERRDFHSAQSERHPGGPLQHRRRTLGRSGLRLLAPAGDPARQSPGDRGAAHSARPVEIGTRLRDRLADERRVHRHARHAIRDAPGNRTVTIGAAVYPTALRRTDRREPGDRSGSLAGPERHLAGVP